MARLPISYARQPYDNADYVRTMADLMLRRSAALEQARLQRGASTADAWNRVGNIAMTGLAAYGQGKDQEAATARQEQQRLIENELKRREMEERSADRKSDLEYRREQTARQTRLDNETLADRAFERMPVGEEIDAAEMQRRGLTGTQAGEQLTPMAAMAERLPATPLIETAGIPSYGRDTRQPGEDDLLGPERRTMSQDTAARPERFRRGPTQTEAMAIENAARQEAARLGLEWERMGDRERQAARDKAEDAYREATLAIRRQTAARAGQGGGTDQVVQTPNGWVLVDKDTGQTRPVMGDGGKPLQRYGDTSDLGAYQSAFDFAISKVRPNNRQPYINTAERLVAEGDKAQLLSYVKKMVLDNVGVDMQNQAIGREGAVASLNDAKQVLTQLQAENIPTGWLTGTAENLYQRLGSSQNPRYVALGTQLGVSLANYRRSMTGAAFGQAEGEDYKTMWPNYKSEFPVNMAKIDGLLNAFDSYDKSFWRMQLGPSAETLFGPGGGAAPAPASGGAGTITRDANGKPIIQKPGGGR